MINCLEWLELKTYKGKFLEMNLGRRAVENYAKKFGPGAREPLKVLDKR